MASNFQNKIKFAYYVGDLLALNTAIFIAVTIKFFNGIEFHATQYPELFIAFNAIWLLLVTLSKAYESTRVDKFSTKVYQTLGLIGFHALLIAALWVSTKAYFYSREFLVLTYAYFSGIMLIWRAIMIYSIRFYRRSGLNHKNVIVYGFGDIATELVNFFTIHPEYGYQFKGYFDDDNADESEVIGSFEEINAYVRDNKIDEIYCCLPYVDYKNIKTLIDFGDETLVKIKLLTDFRGFSSKGVELQRYDHIPILNITSTPLDDWKNRLVKRTFDIIFSLFVIVFILSWLLPLIAILIRLESKGPTFFRQKRTGQDNKDFYCYKFRSMTVNGASDHQQATRDDGRITKVGRFLRRSSLDELPQFFNVLLGNMSVIGPRPHMLKHTEEYAKKVEKFMARHFVKPGITGLAQAKGYRGETKHLHQMKNRVKLDRFYVENWSMTLDLKILALTTVVLFGGDENAF